jgi:hypothetical protein
MPTTTFAQSSASLPEVQELRTQLQGAVPRQAPQAPPAPSQAAASPHFGEATAGYQTFAANAQGASRFQNVPFDPTYQGYFALPGTQTLLKIGAYARIDFMYDLKTAGNSDEFILSSIPIPQVSGVYTTNLSIRPTRLDLDFQTPKSPVADFRFYIVNGISSARMPSHPGPVGHTARRETWSWARPTRISWTPTPFPTLWTPRDPMRW